MSTENLEMRLAHYERMVAELSDVVARQDADIAKLQRQVSALLNAEKERARSEAGGIFVGDERPPHY